MGMIENCNQPSRESEHRGGHSEGQNAARRAGRGRQRDSVAAPAAALPPVVSFLTWAQAQPGEASDGSEQERPITLM
jgi:hypothetical protein